MIRGRHQLVAAATTTLQLWLPSTLRQTARDAGLDPDSIRPPKTWTRPTSRGMPDHRQLPMVLVTSTGWVDRPDFNGDGSVDAIYDLVVNPLARADGFEATADLISIYAAAVRTCLEQNRTLGVDWVYDLRVVGETFGEEIADDSRTLAEALVLFEVAVCGIHDRTDRPAAPPPVGAWPDAPTVLTTSVTTDPLEG